MIFTDNKDERIRQSRDDHAVGHHAGRRRVDDDEVEFLARLFDHLANLVGVQYFGGFLRNTAAGQDEQPEALDVFDGFLIRGFALDDGDQAGLIVIFHADGAQNGGLTQVGVHKQNGLALLGERSRDVDGDGRFTFVLIGRRDNECFEALVGGKVFDLGADGLDALDESEADLVFIGDQQPAGKQRLFVDQTGALADVGNGTDHGGVGLVADVVDILDRVAEDLHEHHDQRDEKRARHKRQKGDLNGIVAVVDDRGLRIIDQADIDGAGTGAHIIGKNIQQSIHDAGAEHRIASGDLQPENAGDRGLGQGHGIAQSSHAVFVVQILRQTVKHGVAFHQKTVTGNIVVFVRHNDRDQFFFAGGVRHFDVFRAGEFHGRLFDIGRHVGRLGKEIACRGENDAHHHNRPGTAKQGAKQLEQIKPAAATAAEQAVAKQRIYGISLGFLHRGHPFR